MSAWFYAYAFVAFWFFVAEAVESRKPVLSAISGMMWPVALPLGLWVVFNPKKAERIRKRYGTEGRKSGLALSVGGSEKDSSSGAERESSLRCAPDGQLSAGGEPDYRGIALSALTEMRKTGESYEMCARWIDTRIRAATKSERNQ